MGFHILYMKCPAAAFCPSLQPHPLRRLLCVHNAKEGGHSSWTSSVSVHNRILELAPDLARTLAQRGAWYFDRKVRRSSGRYYV